MIEAPLFRSTQDALVFAFQYSAQQYELSAMGKVMARVDGAHIPSGKGLVGLDGAAQAGFVRAEIGRLPPPYRAVLRARFGEREAPCPTCGSHGLNQDWKAAISQITNHVAYAISGLSHTYLRRVFVADHFGEPVRIADEADRYGVPHRTAYDHRQKVREALRAEERAAFEAIDSRLREVGMVGEESVTTTA